MRTRIRIIRRIVPSVIHASIAIMTFWNAGNGKVVPIVMPVSIVT
jgi:hypothetical protein